MKVLPVAFYLPQYHPIPENDEWWGKGFTEWTNVAKAKPLYRGHLQPFLPSSLGYYDLRVPEIRIEQARLAREAGIEAFCYWHYWFGGGKRLLERPFNEVLETGKPEYPFCLAWANESWTGKWHGLDDKVLVSQTYNGVADYKEHFYSLVSAFGDNRYFKVNGRNLFVVYATINLPEPNLFIETWRYLAQKEGLPDFFFVGVKNNEVETQKDYDGWIQNQPTIRGKVSHPFPIEKALFKLSGMDLMKFWRFRTLKGPKIYYYKDYVKESFNNSLSKNEFPTVLPNWDNTPRCLNRGLVLDGSTPELYGILLEKAISLVKDLNPKLLFIKAWNEWAEGNTLEPSMQFEDSYLEMTKSILRKHNKDE
jgi:hypothetical protein